MSGARNTADLAAYFGAQESGKSSLMKIETVRARPARLLIWDPKHEYGQFGSPLASLPDLVRAVRAPRFALAFRPALARRQMREQFNVFCLAASRAGNVALIVDELADVTEPGWAPEGWDVVTRQGRHARLVIKGASQRPAEVDKSFYGNATRIVCFRLQAEGDLDRVAKLMRRPREEIAGLAPLEYFDLNTRSGTVKRKKITPRDFARLPA